MTPRVTHVLDADIRRFFDSVYHQWLLRMLAHRIADPRILRLIKKWLERKAMIDRSHKLPLTRQAAIDELHLEYPFAGARMLRDMLRRRGFAVGRRHIAALMRRMGIEACIVSLRRLVAIPSTLSFRTYYAAWQSSAPITCGAPTSRTSRCVTASSICSPFSIGRLAAFWRGACLIR